MNKINRREFTVLTAGAIACCAGLGDETLAAATTLDAGDVKSFDKDGVYDAFAKSNKVLIVREASRIFAMSAMCTHKSCIVKKKDDTLVCPCHGSTFTNDGKATKEPAKAALLRCGVSINSENHLIVNRAKLFGEREWNNKAAWVEIKP